MKTKLTLAVCLLLNLNNAVRLHDADDQIDEIDDSGLTSLGSMVKQQNSLKNKENIMTKKESDSESSKPSSDAAGEPKAPVAVVQKKDEAATAVPAKEDVPAKDAEKSEEKETKPDKTEEVSTKDFEIKSDELT